MISELERGHFEDHTLRAIRCVAAVLDIRIDQIPRWRGGDLGRLLNARHAVLQNAGIQRFDQLPEWQAWPEVTFAMYGERGSIDILAWHPPSGCLLIVELKTEIVDIGELISTLDRKARLAARVAVERGLPRPASVSRWVLVTDTTTNRRRVGNHAALLKRAYPVDGREMPAWLRNPSDAVSALSFASFVARGDTRRLAPAVHRVHVPRRAAPEP